MATHTHWHTYAARIQDTDTANDILTRLKAALSINHTSPPTDQPSHVSQASANKGARKSKEMEMYELVSYPGKFRYILNYIIIIKEGSIIYLSSK